MLLALPVFFVLVLYVGCWQLEEAFLGNISALIFFIL
jgi:hypothetical protein